MGKYYLTVYGIPALIFFGSQAYLCWRQPVAWLTGALTVFIMLFAARVDHEIDKEKEGEQCRTRATSPDESES